MRKDERKYSNGFVFFKRNLNAFFVVFAICFFSACRTIPPWTSSSLTLKIKGNLMSSKSRIPWTAYAYLKGEDHLRTDVITPLGGTIFRIFSKDDQITLLFPVKKSYCEPPLNSYKFWPKGPLFSVTDLYHLLRDKTPEKWSCSPSAETKSTLCILPEGNFKISLKQKRKKKILELKEGGKLHLTLTIIPLSGKLLEDKVFSFNTQDWTRLTDCKEQVL